MKLDNGCVEYIMLDFLPFKHNVALITDNELSLTYGQLIELSDSFAESYSAGLVFTLCENVLGSFVGYIACLRKHIPQVLLDGKKSIEQLLELIAVYQPEYIWVSEKRADEFCGERIFSYGDYSLLAMRYNHPLVDKEINPKLLLCLTTSGSTGSPKFVRLSEKNLLSNARSIAEYLNITEGERPVTVLPMYYSFGMSVINSHLIKGATLLLTDKAIMQREFWDFLKSNNATSIAGVPYTYEMLKRLRFFRMDLPGLKTMVQAGGKLSSEYVKEFADFAKQNGKQFVVMYGQTEASPRMSYLPFDRAIEKNASIGIAIPGGAFRLIDGDGMEIHQPNIDGELIYEGENVCLGYAETRMQLSDGDVNRGVLHTGDIAHFDEEGFFYITGRLKRFVKIWGNRTNLDAIEQLAKTVVASCACVGVDDLITIFVTETGKEDEIKNMLVEKTGFFPRAFKIRAISEIPVMPNGKIDYQLLMKNL